MAADCYGPNCNCRDSGLISTLLAELLKKLEKPPVLRFDLAGQADLSKERLEKSDCPNCGRNLGA